MFLAPFPDPTDYAEKLDVSKLPCESLLAVILMTACRGNNA